MTLSDISKFTFPEMFNDSQGKTQGVLVCGIVGFFIFAFGVMMCITIPAIMVLLHIEKDPVIIAFFSSSKDTCSNIAMVCFAGVTAHVFSKSKTVSTTTSEIVMEKETIKTGNE
jgi:hypothetical protein